MIITREYKSMTKVSIGSNNKIGIIKLYGKKLAIINEVAFAFGIIGILLVLLFPVPTLLLDFLLALSITVSVMILMMSLFINRALDLSVFPTLLLVTAVLRLSLNIASTRLILSHGHNGPDAAGEIIAAFGSFVMGGSLVIGIIVFAILTIINFIVITKGSGRIAEVAARFSLDAMPGKQMAIDADLSAGLIDEETAKLRRRELESESSFFGAMDGANKFVKGDAIAGLLITFINFIAGLIIGIVQRDLAFGDAIQTYTTLTIGDGLVSQIPALIISLASGLLVTKSGISGATDKVIFSQISKYPQALGMSAILMCFMGLMPGIPAIPFFFLAIVVGFLTWYLITRTKSDAAIAEATPETQAEGKDDIQNSLQIDSLKLELGFALLPLINHENGHNLTDQIKAIRKQMAEDIGFIIPSIRIQDNLQLPAETYSIKIKDIECGKGNIKPNKLLVMNPTGGEIELEGQNTLEPTFGIKAKWVEENLREEALYKNYTVVDAPTVITTHMSQIVKDNITDLLSYSETQKLLDSLGADHKKLLGEVIPSVVSVNIFQRILQNLLSENISVRDLPAILEALGEIGGTTKNITNLTEYVRQKLSRQICTKLSASSGYIPLLPLSQKWEQIFTESIAEKGGEEYLAIAPSQLKEFISRLSEVYEKNASRGELGVILATPRIRPHLRNLLERYQSQITVLSQSEIHPKIKIKTLEEI